MTLTLLKAKLHRACVTGAELDYEGSISIDVNLLKASGILPYEKVEIYNVNNGARFSTYVIKGGPGEICLNGAAARMVQKNDRVIIAAYAQMEQTEAERYKPIVILLDEKNQIKD